MARIIGVEIPPNKRIDIALRYIYGIGPVNAVRFSNARTLTRPSARRI
jgi:ribosomal protein S13